MRVGIVQPFHPSNVKLFGKNYMSALTLPVLAALTPADAEVELLDENVTPLDFDAPFDLVGITVLTAMASRAYEISREYRKRGKTVVLGGVHPSLMPEEAGRHADAIVIGEAEDVWAEVVEDFRCGRLKKVYQREEKPDLAGLPIPRRDLVQEHHYVNIPKVETSRGCPFNCTFCSTTVFFGNRIRYRPVEEVVSELRHLASSFVFFTDNNIIGNVRYAKELFRGLKELGIKWISQGSVNVAMDQELLHLAADSGCVGLLIGLESLSQIALEKMGKKVNEGIDFRRAVKAIHKVGIGIIGCFVLGFDEDDEGVFDRTRRFIKRMNIEVPQLTVLTPYPGTVLRERLESANRIIHDRWEKYDSTHVVFFPENMSPQELRRRYDEMCRKLYSIRAIAWRTARSLLYLRSFYKWMVYWQVNVVYRRLYRSSLDDHKLIFSPEFAKLFPRRAFPVSGS